LVATTARALSSLNTSSSGFPREIVLTGVVQLVLVF
jgi:hypothetical protein